MSKATETNKQLSQSILDLLSYCAVFKLGLSDQQILWYLPVKASLVGVRSHLAKLQKRGKIKKLSNDSYGIKSISYPSNSKKSQDIIKTNLKRAHRWAKVFARLPFVKAVVLSSDTVVDLHNPGLNLQFIFITLPSRIYITKGSLYQLLKVTGKRRNSTNTQDSVYLNMFYTTAGLRFVDSMGQNPTEQILWFTLAQPLYGTKDWNNLLQKDSFLHKNLPNFAWQYKAGKILTTHSRQLDYLDNVGYKKHLRHVADQPEFHGEEALLRVRPDALIARPNHKIRLKQIDQEYTDIRSKL